MESPKRKSFEGTSTSSPGTKRSRLSPSKNKEHGFIGDEQNKGFEVFGDPDGARLNSPSLQPVQESELNASSTLSYSQQIVGAGENPKNKSQNGFSSGAQDALANSTNSSTLRLRQRTPQVKPDTTTANRTVHFQSNLVSTNSMGMRAPEKSEEQIFQSPPSVPQQSVDEDTARYEAKNIALAAFCLCVLGSLLYLSYHLLGIDPPTRL
jgi:hypothetical protein